MPNMSCSHPRTLIWKGGYTKRGAKQFEYSSKDWFHDIDKLNELLTSEDGQRIKGIVSIPCGCCLFCQMKKRAEVGERAMLESLFYDDNMFLTLTVDEDHIEEVFPHCELRHRPFELFAKRLRKYISKTCKGRKIKVLMCGEYGDEGNRPHYHAIVFGFKFEDVRPWGRYFLSEKLSELWPYGFHLIGDVTFDSCSYIAKYVYKSHGVEVKAKKKPYIIFPKGLGKSAFDKFYDQWYDLGYLRTEKGFIMKMPRYFDKKLEEIDPDRLKDIKQKRIEKLLSDEIKVQNTYEDELNQYLKNEFYNNLRKIYSVRGDLNGIRKF